MGEGRGEGALEVLVVLRSCAPSEREVQIPLARPRRRRKIPESAPIAQMDRAAVS
jgi:hypothetical protein